MNFLCRMRRNKSLKTIRKGKRKNIEEKFLTIFAFNELRQFMKLPPNKFARQKPEREWKCEKKKENEKAESAQEEKYRVFVFSHCPRMENSSQVWEIWLGKGEKKIYHKLVSSRRSHRKKTEMKSWMGRQK